MENRAHALLAGAFTLAFVAALVAVALWLGGSEQEDKPYLLVSHSPISGLSAQAGVRLRGLSVGRVVSVRFAPDSPRKILIRISVAEDTPVTYSTYAQVSYQGLTGIAYIQLDDTGKDLRPLATSPERPASVPVRPPLLEEVGNSAQQIVARLDQTTIQVNKVLSDRNVAHLSQTLANLATLTEALAGLPQRLEPTLAALPEVAAETREVVRRSGEVVDGVNELTRGLQTRLEALDRVTANTERITASGAVIGHELRTNLVPKVDRALDDLTVALRDFDKLVNDLERRPQSLIFGKPDLAPGPGETGFEPPP